MRVSGGAGIHDRTAEEIRRRAWHRQQRRGDQ